MSFFLLKVAATNASTNGAWVPLTPRSPTLVSATWQGKWYHGIICASLVRSELLFSHAAFCWGSEPVLLKDKWTSSNKLSVGPSVTPPLDQAELRPIGHRTCGIPTTLHTFNSSQLVTVLPAPSRLTDPSDVPLVLIISEVPPFQDLLLIEIGYLILFPLIVDH